MWKPLNEKSVLRNALNVNKIRKEITEWDLEYLPYDEEKKETVIIFRRKDKIDDVQNEEMNNEHEEQ